MDQLRFIGIGTAWARALLFVPVVLALVCCWYAVRWYAGNTVADYAPEAEEGALEIAQSALRLAPADPLAHWTMASLEKRSLDPELLPDVVRQYEEAASLSPNDYRLWMDLGVAREQAGDRTGGEKALRHAVELAPSYADPRWYLGNLLLRAGQREEAFAQLRRAGEANPKTYRPQIFNLAWQLYGGDAGRMKDAVGDSATARGELASYLAGRGHPDDAVGLWSSLSPAEKLDQREVGAALMNSLIAAKSYRAALALYRDLLTEGGDRVAIGQFQNGGFENNLAEPGIAGGGAFGWQLKPVPQAQIAIDERNRHSGARSLRVTLNASNLFNFDNISQLVVVEPSTQYRFECYVRTADLKTAGAPLIAIVDSTDGSVLGTSGPVAAGSNDWQPLTLSFKTTAKTEAVTVVTARAPCTVEASVCPIFGTIWYDDFNLQPGGAGGPGTGRQQQQQQGGARPEAKGRNER